MQRLKEEVKKRILEAGKKRFKNDGFTNASMRDIAKDAEISTGNIYRYFLTKSHLLDEILNDLEAELEEFFNSIPDKYEVVKDETFFKRIIDKIITLYEKREAEICILFGAKNEKQFLVFKENVLNMFSNKIIAISNSMNMTITDSVVTIALSRSLFEGVTYIVEENKSNTELLRKRLYAYIEIMSQDLDKRVKQLILESCSK